MSRYVSASVWALAAALCRWSLHPILGNETRFGFFILFVLFVAWRAGVGPAVWTAVVSLAVILTVFADGLVGQNSAASAVLLVILNYVAPVWFGIYLIESLHRSVVAAQAEAERRRQAEAELEKARCQLRDYAFDLEKTVQIRTAELNEAVGFLENFCYSIAHDLRAPMRAISGFCMILEEEQASELSEASRLHLRKIQEASMRMDRLITSLLDYGHLSHVPLQVGNVDLNEVVNRAVASLRDKLNAVGGTVDVRETLGCAFADAALLESALREIVQNSVQFRNPNEPLRVRIYVKVAEHSVRLWVHDNGVGIPNEYTQKLFKLFQTLEQPESQHVGFGLAFVAKAAERMNGAVGVESAPGKGSAFWIDLPRGDWRQSKAARPEQALLVTERSGA